MCFHQKFENQIIGKSRITDEGNSLLKSPQEFDVFINRKLILSTYMKENE